MDGGKGNDTYYIDNLSDTVIEQADGGEADKVIISQNYTLVDQVEILELRGNTAINGIGNVLDNAIEGNPQNNLLQGKGGDDTLRGMAGDDTLDGGVGNDSLDGGEGYDRAKFYSSYDNFKLTLEDGSWTIMDAQSGTDSDGTDSVQNVEQLVFTDLTLYWFDGAKQAPGISDFVSGVDQIAVLATAFGFPGSGSNTSGTPLNPSAFYAASGASAGREADDRFIYDTGSGQLYFDKDGSGATPAIPLVRLVGQPPLEAGDVMLWG